MDQGIYELEVVLSPNENCNLSTPCERDQLQIKHNRMHIMQRRFSSLD